MKFLKALLEFIFGKSLDNIPDISDVEAKLIFLMATGVFGLLIVFVDIVFYRNKNKSFLGLHYTSSKRNIETIICWPIASAIVGLVLLSLNVITPKLQSCPIVAISWMYIMINLVDKYSKPNAIQKNHDAD